MARISNAFKSFTSPSGPTESETRGVAHEAVDYGKEQYGDLSSAPRRNAATGSQKLPPGTGPGTSGKPASEYATDFDRNRLREQGRSTGTQRAVTDRDREHYGAEPSTGSGLRTNDRGSAVVSPVPMQSVPVASTQGTGITDDQGRLVRRGSEHASELRSEVLETVHNHGHTRHSTRDIMPSGAAQEDTNQLNPITHERIRHLETEEVARVKEVDRHIHHVQHHIQPVIASETLTEQIRDFIHPVTTIREVHVNNLEDDSLFDSQIRQHNDTLTHLERERTIIDKGVTVKETIHHHVHHVIQPIIEKETIDRQRIRTTIPIHEVSHDAPIIHQSQTHNAVPIEHFLQKGGILHNAIPPNDIGSRVLHSGQCTREIDGVADNLAKELKLAESHREPGVTTDKLLGHRDDMTTFDVGSKKKPSRAPDTQADEPVRVPIN